MKIILIILILCISYNFSAQTTEQKIIDIYGSEKISTMKIKNPGRYQYLTGMVEKGIKIIDPPLNKFDAYPEIDAIPLQSKTATQISISEFLIDYDKSSFNALMYKFSATDQIQYFRLTGTSKVLVIQSQKSFY